MGKQPQRTRSATKREDASSERVKTATGKVLRTYRNAKNLTQQDLGIVSNVGSIFISRIETGSSSPTIVTVFKLTQALGVSPWEFLKNVEEELAVLQKEHSQDSQRKD